VDAENFFICGLDRDGVSELLRRGYDPQVYYENDPDLRLVIDMISQGYFSPAEPQRYQAIHDALLRDGDRYLLLADFASYRDTQKAVAELYLDPEEWSRRAILNVARLGYFSSDRTIQEYAEQIWQAEPVVHE